MTLPASGEMSMNDIWVELGSPSSLKPGGADLSLTSMSTYSGINAACPDKPDGVAPHAVSEWFSYDDSYAPAPTSLDALEITATRCDLTWSLNGDTTHQIQFERYRYGSWTSAFTRPANTTSYSDTGYDNTADTAYRCRFDLGGGSYSAWSNTAYVHS